MKNGILYRIVNRINDREYIGVTANKLKTRWNEHLSRLRNGLGSPKLQADFNKYGEDCFFIEEISQGSIEEMFLKEKELTNGLPFRVYNSIIGGNDPERMMEAHLIWMRKLNENPEYKKAYLKKVGDGNRGKIMSVEARKKMAAAKTGTKWDEAQRLNRMSKYKGSGNPNYGKYRWYLNIETGVYYNTTDMYFLFNTNKSGLRWKYKKKDPVINSFIKV